MADGDRLLFPSGRRIILPDGRRKIATGFDTSCGCCGCDALLGGNPRLRVTISVTPCSPREIDYTETCTPPPGPATIQYSGQFTPLDISGVYNMGFQQPPGSFVWRRTILVSQTLMTWSRSGVCGSTGGSVSGGRRSESVTIQVYCDSQGRVACGASVTVVPFGDILGAALLPCPAQNFNGLPQNGLQIPGIDGGGNECPYPSQTFPGFWDCGAGGFASGSATVEILP